MSEIILVSLSLDYRGGPIKVMHHMIQLLFETLMLTHEIRIVVSLEIKKCVQISAFRSLMNNLCEAIVWVNLNKIRDWGLTQIVYSK